MGREGFSSKVFCEGLLPTQFYYMPILPKKASVKSKRPPNYQEVFRRLFWKIHLKKMNLTLTISILTNLKGIVNPFQSEKPIILLKLFLFFFEKQPEKLERRLFLFLNQHKLCFPVQSEKL